MQRRNLKNYVQIDKYQVDFTKKLGEGGMASVYLGYYAPGCGDPDTLFAVKQIPINAKFEVTDSLLQEINLLRKLNHPNIVRFIDARKSVDYMYLILEYCNQGTLENLILSKQEKSEKTLLEIFTQIVIALKFLQEKKIIHRDIKPKNILIHNERVKIADFGVAKMIDQHKENISFSGTVPFMSPQIIRQEKYTSLTDMWSLGVTLYFMIFKKLPWSSVHPVKILNQITIKINNGLVLPQENISPFLRFLIERMLVIQEESRLKWAQLFDHDIIKVHSRIIEDIDQSMEDSRIEEPEEITIGKFLHIINKNASQNYELLQKRGKDINENYRASKIKNQLGREAQRKLINHKEHIVFFGKMTDSLKEIKKKSTQNKNLFLKCQFLLTKRSYILSRDLHQILSFSTHAQGIIIIPKDEFAELISDKNLKIWLKRMKDDVERQYDKNKSIWAETKQQFYKALRNQQNFNLIDRGEAYTDNTIQTKNLILAFNDCFLQLFFLLSQKIVTDYQKQLYVELTKSDIFIKYGVDITLIYDLMVLLCFHNLNEKTNFQTYYDKRKYTNVHEILYRIILGYKTWKKLKA